EGRGPGPAAGGLRGLGTGPPPPDDRGPRVPADGDLATGAAALQQRRLPAGEGDLGDGRGPPARLRGRGARGAHRRDPPRGELLRGGRPAGNALTGEPGPGPRQLARACPTA